MPTVGVSRDWLFEVLGKEYTEKEFQDLCFEFGLELDDVETADILKRTGLEADEEGVGDGKAEQEVVYKIDVPANRYDLLCHEGLVRGLRVFRGDESTPQFNVIKPPDESMQMITARKDVLRIRPFVVSAVLRDITFTERSFYSFIELQDKLHHNICRQRSLVAIGTHDLDKIEGPFTYDALPPDQIKFQALKQTKEHTATELMELYKKDMKLKAFLHIIKDSPVYPVIYDKNKRVLSMPPIINGELSKMTMKTTNVFIECTATDFTKAQIVLNTMVTMFSQYCAKPFSVEAVNVTQGSGDIEVMPNLGTWDLEVSVPEINRSISKDVHLSRDEVAQYLQNMQLNTDVPDGCHDTLTVHVPVVRSDILHECDVIEDVAIAYGYNKLIPTVPPVDCTATVQPVNKVGDALRESMAQIGYTEVFTFALCQEDEVFAKLNRPIDDSVVRISNPKTQDFQIARPTLLPGVLKCLANNKSRPLPLRLFECSDVVVKEDPGVTSRSRLANPVVHRIPNDVGARNERRLCAAYMAKASGLELIHGVVDKVMQMLDVKVLAVDNGTLLPHPTLLGEDGGNVDVDAAGGSSSGPHEKYYTIKPSADPAFFEGRRADILLMQGDQSYAAGVFGILHPQVIRAYELVCPVSALELNVEYFI